MTIYFPKYLRQTCSLIFMSIMPPLLAQDVAWETDIQPIVTDNCSGCHSGEDPSGGINLEAKQDVLKLKAKIIKVVSEGIMPQDNPDFIKTPDGIKFLEWMIDQVTYEGDIQPLVAKTCSRCHNPQKLNGGLSFDKAEIIIAARARITAAVSSGKMPRGDKTWKDTPDAKMFLSWLATFDKPTPKPPKEEN